MVHPSIAIIGMRCIYPGAHSPEELWENILTGRRYFRRTPDERIPLADYFDPEPTAPGKTCSDQMADPPMPGSCSSNGPTSLKLGQRLEVRILPGKTPGK